MSTIKGTKFTKEHRDKMAKAKLGNKWNLGKKRPEHSKRMMGENNPMWGKRNLKCSQKMRGDKNPNWKGGVSLKNQLERASSKMYFWRKAVLARDGYRCQVCKKVGGNLETHHIKEWINYPRLRFIIDNGITLCKNCHQLTPNYRNKGRKQKQLNKIKI